MDAFKILATAISAFIKKYNSTHRSPTRHSGKLFCVELPEDKIKELEQMVEIHCEDSGQRSAFCIIPNETQKTLIIFGTHFKILTGNRCLIYEPSSFYTDSGVKKHFFKQNGIIIDNSVEISFP